MLPYQKVTKHQFNGKTYNMAWRRLPARRNIDGLCAAPDRPPKRRTITINPNLEARRFMEIVLHEGLHAEQWYLDEPTVVRIGESLSSLLWRCGYRLTDGKGNIIDHPKKQKGEPVKARL